MRVQRSTANFIPGFRKPLLLLLVSHYGSATDNIPGLRVGTSRHHHVLCSQPLSEAVPPLSPFYTWGEKVKQRTPGDTASMAKQGLESTRSYSRADALKFQGGERLQDTKL